MSRHTRAFGSLMLGCVFASSAARAGENDPIDPQWRGSIERNLAALEYHASMTETGVLCAPNRAQNLRITFGPGGVTMRPRVGDEPSFEFGWTFAAFGREPNLAAPAVATPRANGNRVEYVRGDVTEWYVNDTRGIEHGFSIATRPLGVGELVVDLAVVGTLTPRERADAIEFVTAGDAVAVRYDHLAVIDADGDALSATLRASGDTIRIAIDDRDASYPITIDPLTTSPAWTANGDQVSAEFGASVGTAGDVNGDGYSDVIVGAPIFDNGQTDEGKAFVYLGSSTGLASSPAWTAEVNQTTALFGWSVGTAGDVNGDGFCDVIVGARFFSAGQLHEGRAYVYQGSAAGLGASLAWTAESNQADALFGASVSTAGDPNKDGFSDVIVGAPLFDNGTLNEGQVFVYLGSATGVKASPHWTADGNQSGIEFGSCVASADANADGHTDVFIGAPGYANGQTGEGRVVSYFGSSQLSVFTATPWWTAESDQVGAKFGASVASAGDVNGDGYGDLIVGAPFYDNGQTDEGRAFVYQGGNISLTNTPTWTAESDQANASMGASVGSAGDVNADGFADVVIGASRYTNGQAAEGRAFVYLGSSTGPAPAPMWTAEGDQVAAFFGAAVGTAGDVNGDGFSDLIVGAYDFDDGQTDEGRAFVYLGSVGNIGSSPAWIGEGDQFFASFGLAIAPAGDVNDDGFADVIVGAPDFDNGEVDEGRTFLFAGSATGLAAAPMWTAESDQVGARFGASVASAGDVNGDGRVDVIVGANLFDNGQTDEGRATVYFGHVNVFGSPTPWVVEGNQDFARYGSSVATAGDVNADGYYDVIIGAPLFDHGQANEGSAFVFHGSANGLATQLAWKVESDQLQAQLGASVATAGDVDGDGYSEVIVGAPLFDVGLSDEGAVFVYRGGVSGPSVHHAWMAHSNQSNSQFGVCAAPAGDVNGDGLSDVIVGAPTYANGQFDEGRAFVYTSSALGLGAGPAWTAEADQPNAMLGGSVASAGDVNNDGYADVIVGAAFFNEGQGIEGAAFVYTGSATGLGVSPAWMEKGEQLSSSFGKTVATAGDVNGDGYADVIVGAPQWNDGQSGEGAVFQYLGNGSKGYPVKPRTRGSLGGPNIPPLGRTHADKYRVNLSVHSPYARTDGRILIESKPLGVAFDGSNLLDGGPVQSLGPNNEYSIVVPGVAAATPYHWRARVVYDPVKMPYQPAGPWFSAPGTTRTETALRGDPCFGALGSASVYGGGKPGTLGVPQLVASASALGGTVGLRLLGGLPGAAPVALVVGLNKTNTPFDGGALLVDPAFIWPLPPLSASGEFLIQMPVIADPTLCGLFVRAQAMFVDPGAAGAYHTAQSNGVEWTLGS